MKTFDELKAEVASEEIRDGRRVFPLTLRRAALEYAEQEVAVGKTVSAVARELDLVECTLSRWSAGAWLGGRVADLSRCQ